MSYCHAICLMVSDYDLAPKWMFVFWVFSGPAEALPSQDSTCIFLRYWEMSSRSWFWRLSSCCLVGPETFVLFGCYTQGGTSWRIPEIQDVCLVAIYLVNSLFNLFHWEYLDTCELLKYGLLLGYTSPSLRIQDRIPLEKKKVAPVSLQQLANLDLPDQGYLEFWPWFGECETESVLLLVKEIRQVVFPVIYKFLYIPGSAGFFPSTIVGKTCLSVFAFHARIFECTILLGIAIKKHPRGNSTLYALAGLGYKSYIHICIYIYYT